MLKKFFNTKSFLFKYISVLFIALLIPTFFGFIVSEVSLHSTLNEIKSKNYQSLTHIQRSFDSTFTEIKQLSIEIASGNDLINYSENPLAYNAYDIINTEFIPGTVMAREYVHDVFIYNNERDIIINSNSSIYTVNQYCEEILNIHGQDRVDFVNIMKTPAFSEVYPAKSIKPQNRTAYKPYIFHAQSYPLNADYKGNVIAILNMEKLVSSFEDKFTKEDCSFFITDNTGRLLFSVGKSEYVMPSFSEKKEGFGNGKIGGDSITYCIRDSTYGDFKYIFIENIRSVESTVLPVRAFLYIYILFILIFGTIGIYWIAKKNTKPIRDITGMLQNGESGDKNSGDELENIRFAIRNILNEKVRREPIIEQSKSALRKNLISDILRSNFMSEEQIQEACNRVEISFLHQFFCVIYYSLDEISQEDIAVIKYAISNIATELFTPVGEVFTDDSDLNSVVVIINMPDKSIEIQRQILAQLSFMRSFFVDNFETEIHIGVGNIIPGPAQISSSYAQARESAEYCALTGSREVLPYVNIKTGDYRYSYPLDVEDKLHSAVINGDIELVRQLIDQVVNANASLSLDMSRCLFFDLTATALKIMSNKAINLSAVFGSINSPFERLMECKNIAELVETIHDIFEKICTQITENHSAKKEKLKIAIIDYVKDNYNDPNMSLGMVADEFEMNYTYMSHFFKDFIGSNFIDYISELRVKKAAELLRDTDMPVNEIATSVGYANATVLIKIFKKITKTTPGMYRKNSKE